MASLDKFNAFEILKRGLEGEVKAVIAKDIIDEQVKLLKVRLQAEPHPLILQAVTFEHIENYRDFALMRDEIRVYIKVDGSVFDTHGDK